jgi:hypothetical protein
LLDLNRLALRLCHHATSDFHGILESQEIDS